MTIRYHGKTTHLTNPRKRKASSKRWLTRQLNDPYVFKAKIDGYRSRAAYKLLEINEKFKLLKPGMNVIDLGAAPGGWSQIAAEITKSYLNNMGQVIAIDLLEFESLPGVTSIIKDFYDPDSQDLIYSLLSGQKADLVLSDMAANTTGHSTTDHIRIIALCECALNFALTILKTGGNFVAKVFRGGTEHELLKKVKLNFHIVKHFKPISSRKDSAEFYLIALNKK